MTASAGTCYGYAVASDLSFEYLRSGTGEPLRVTETTAQPPEPDLEMVFEIAPSPGRPLHARLFEERGSARYWLWTDDAGWFSIDAGEPAIAIPPTMAPPLREQRVWGLPTLLCFLARGDLPLHAASIEVAGGALVVAGPSGFGKTTLAAAAAAGGHRLLAEDLTCIRLRSVPAVIPGPAGVRLRRDIAASLSLPGARRVHEDDERIHFALDPLSRGDCVPVPLKGIVLLRESETDVRVEEVAAADALKDLWLLSFRVPTEADSRRCFQMLADLCGAARVWNLFRPMTVASLQDATRVLASLASDHAPDGIAGAGG